MVPTSSSFRTCLTGLALLAAMSGPSRAGFLIQDLGVLVPSGTSDATAIGANGEAAGSATGTHGATVAVMASGFGASFQMAGAPSGAQSSVATGINLAGDIAGYYTDLNGNTHGFMSSQGQATTIGPFLVNGQNTVSTQANGINDFGTAVGTGTLPGGATAAFRASGGGSPTAIDPLVAGGSNMGAGINDSGTVIGSSQATTTGLVHAFIATASGTLTDLSRGPNAGIFTANTYGAGIANNGNATGYGDVGPSEHAFFAPSTGGPLVDLGVTARAANGPSVQGISSFGRGVNDLSFVVGELDLGGSGPGSSDTDAFLWSSSQGMVDLNSLIPAADQLGWRLLTASAINDSSQIVGEGYFNGVLHGYELTPDASGAIFTPAAAVPAPPALILSSLGCGIAAAWARIRRERTGGRAAS